MNAIVVEQPSAVKATIRSLARAAHTLSRVSVQKAQWAREAERQGKPDLAARYQAEADEKREHAEWHLRQAMQKKDLRYGRS